MTDIPAAISDPLKAEFTPRHVSAALKHFEEMVSEFQLGNWEKSISKGGKFIEAILKLLWAKAGDPVPSGRAFKADNLINQLPQKAALTSDSLRLTIPRVCRVIYDIASNRGGRHDPDEVDPNEMDATVVVSNAQWILGELLRYAEKGSDLSEVAGRIAEVTRRRYPHFENIEGRLYTDIGDGAREVGLMILFRSGRRISRDDLLSSIRRHGFSAKNALMAIKRIASLVDDDGQGRIRLRLKGAREAERIFEEYQKKNRN